MSFVVIEINSTRDESTVELLNQLQRGGPDGHGIHFLNDKMTSDTMSLIGITGGYITMYIPDSSADSSVLTSTILQIRNGFNTIYGTRTLFDQDVLFSHIAKYVLEVITVHQKLTTQNIQMNTRLTNNPFECGAFPPVIKEVFDVDNPCRTAFVKLVYDTMETLLKQYPPVVPPGPSPPRVGSSFMREIQQGDLMTAVVVRITSDTGACTIDTLNKQGGDRYCGTYAMLNGTTNENVVMRVMFGLDCIVDFLLQKNSDGAYVHMH